VVLKSQLGKNYSAKLCTLTSRTNILLTNRLTYGMQGVLAISNAPYYQII